MSGCPMSARLHRVAGWAALWMLQAHAALGQESLTLEVGQQRVLSAAGVRGYSEGAPGIVDVRLTPDGAHFILVGRRAGTTSLLLMLDDGGERQVSIQVGDTRSAPATEPPDGGRVEPRDNIRLDFYFVQLNDEYRHRIGTSWPATVGGGKLSASYDLISGSFTEATAVVTDQALPGLDLAQARGWAKLLRQAALVTANATQASFSAGGEVNVPVSGTMSGDIRSIEFGSQIGVLPRYDRETGRIELTVRADVSDLASDSGTGVPGRQTSTLQSTVNLELGQSLVLAGLIARNQSRAHQGLPGLSEIPIFGPLFGSHAEQSRASESLVFIVPSVVDAVDAEARQLVQDALRQYQAFDGDIDDAELMDDDP